MGVADRGRATAVLSAAGLRVEPVPDGTLLVHAGSQRLDLADITRLLAEHGLYLFELTPIRRDLESVFLELTADQHLGAKAARSSRRPRTATPDWGAL